MRQVKFVSSNDREAVLLSLAEAAQEIADKMARLREVLKEDALVRLTNTHQQLDEALAEEQDEYEFIGTIDGTYAGRWMISAFAENASAVWPDGTAIYVRRVKR